jgi:hypothetical protein
MLICWSSDLIVLMEVYGVGNGVFSLGTVQ